MNPGTEARAGDGVQAATAESADPHRELLAKELLVAERTKATALAALLGVLTAAITVALAVSDRTFTGATRLSMVRVPVIVGAAALYQLGVRSQLTRAVREGHRMPSWLPFLTAAVDVTIPSLGVVVLSSILSPVEALSGPHVLAYGLFLVLSALRLDHRICFMAGAVAAAEYWGLALLLDPLAQEAFRGTFLGAPIIYVGRGVMILLVGVATGLVAREVRRRFFDALRQLEERQRAEGLLGRYVDDEVAGELLSGGGAELGGVAREVTLMMTDLRGFSKHAERRSPQDVVAMLNHYFGVMTEVIREHGGVIDELIGDAIFVFFGAPVELPDHADRAIACALGMQRAMAQVNEHNEAQGYPRLEMGIGIHTGTVVVGSIGCDARSKYGAVGHHVNLTGRIESYTVGGQVLVSETTRAKCAAELRLRGEMEVEPKGSSAPITLFDVAGIGAPFDLALDDSLGDVVDVAPLPVLLRVMQGKDGRGEDLPAEIVALSHEEAELEMEATLPLLSNLRIAVGDGEAFAKVVADGARLRVRFTAIDEAATQALQAASATK